MQLERVEVWGHLKDGEAYLVKFNDRWRTAVAKIAHPDILLKSGALTLRVGEVTECYALPSQSVSYVESVCVCGHNKDTHDGDYCEAIGCPCARFRLQEVK